MTDRSTMTPTVGTGKRYLSTTEVADRLGMTRRNVTYHVRAGNIPGQRVGGTWMIHPDAVTRYQKTMTGARPGPKPTAR